MSKYLTGFSGKFGDIVWSLPTVREISRMVGQPVDFCTMPTYRSLIPLLEAQSYIDKAFVNEEWIMVHSNHGDQPFDPPGHRECLSDHVCRAGQGYAKCWHLGYRAHPGINAPDMPLIDFIAHQQGITFRESPVPFVEAESIYDPEAGCAVERSPMVRPCVSYAFNEQYGDVKQRFLEQVIAQLQGVVNFVDVSKLDWELAAGWIKSSIGYLGCRSANYVLAHGVGQRVLCFEPHPARNLYGSLGRVFHNPYGNELCLDYRLHVGRQVELAVQVLTKWREEWQAANQQLTTSSSSS